ncbi:MAG: hypothetical protein M1836_006889 [Candelina mexicana]|nr:MAG: hypothetical protein M1836_006889 [Candelina mexicana]
MTARAGESPRKPAKLRRREAAMVYSYLDVCPLKKHYIVHQHTVASHTERPKIMSQLEYVLNNVERFSGSPRYLALWGDDYAEKNRIRYDPVIWIDASTPETAIKSYSKAFEDLALDFPHNYIDERRKEASLRGNHRSLLQDDWVIKTVLQWLGSRCEAHSEWLVLIDNADEVNWVQDLIPRGPQGTVLITSRDRSIRDYVRPDIERQFSFCFTDLGPMRAKMPGSSLKEVHIHVPLLQQATHIISALENSALLINLPYQYILQHHHMRENLSLYLVYHNEMSFNLLDNVQLGLQDHYRFTLASVYETSLAAAHNISADSTTLLSLFTFLNGDMDVEDRLFQEAVLGLVKNQKYRPTQHLFSGELQSTLFGLCSGGIFFLLLTCRPQKTHLSGRPKIIARVVMLILPALAGAFFIIGIRLVQRSRFDNDDVTKPAYLVDRSMTSELIICNATSIYYLFFDRFFRIKDIFWPPNILSVMYITPVLLWWLWGRLEYGLDNTLGSHIENSLEGIKFQRTRIVKLERTIVGLEDVSRSRTLVTLVWLQLSLVIVAFPTMLAIRMIVPFSGFIGRVFGGFLADFLGEPLKIIIIYLRRVQRRGVYSSALIWFVSLILVTLGLLLFVPAANGVATSALVGWLISWTPGQTGHVSESYDSHKFDEAIAPLIQYGLLHREPGEGYILRPLTQWWARQRLEPAMRRAWVTETSWFLELVYRSPGCWEDVSCQRILTPYIAEVTRRLVQNGQTDYSRLKAMLEMLIRNYRIIGGVGPQSLAQKYKMSADGGFVYKARLRIFGSYFTLEDIGWGNESATEA